MKFPIFHFPTKLDLGYQRAEDADIFRTVAFGGTPNNPNFTPGNVLPQERFMGTYSVEIFHHVYTSVQYVMDHDFKEKEGGTDRTSYVATMRISAQL